MAGVYRGDHLVYVGNVGTGYGDEKVALPDAEAQGCGIGEEPVRR